MNLPATYRTRGGLVVTINDEDKTTPRSIYYGHFKIRGMKIWIEWNDKLNEIHGEKGLDLMSRLSSQDMEPKS